MYLKESTWFGTKYRQSGNFPACAFPANARAFLPSPWCNSYDSGTTFLAIVNTFPAIACALPAMEDDLSIFWVHTWTQHSKLGGVRLLRFFDMSLCCRNMTEDDLSIFWVRSWTGHGKLGGYAFYGFSIWAFVAVIWQKTTFQFFESVFGLGMVN